MILGKHAMGDNVVECGDEIQSMNAGHMEEHVSQCKQSLKP